MGRATLHLVRHAHTIANEPGTARLAGWSDFDVTTLGESELEALRRVAEQIEVSGAIYSSSSARAMRTAAALAGEKRRVVPLRSLREIWCGELEGWRVSDVKERYPDLWRANEQQSDDEFRWPGGESYARFRQRVIRALRAIAARHPGERRLIVTHAGVISQVVGMLEGTAPAQWEKWRPGNCSITTIEVAGADMKLVAFNERDHLAGVSGGATHQRAG